MFTFSHITSIGISKEEYDRRLAAGETGLAKGENKFYREIPTDVTVPENIDDFIAMLEDERNDTSEKMKLGERKIDVSPSLKNYIVGLKLAVNQRVQAANRDGKQDYDPTIKLALAKATVQSPEWLAAIAALTGKASDKKVFVEKWLEANPQD
jgi:hypothetical protein